MRTLITGGLGFIGRNLVARVATRNATIGMRDEIMIVDKKPIPGFVAGAHVVQAEIGSVRYQERVDLFKPELIYHLASPVGPVGILPLSGRLAGMIIRDSETVADTAVKHKAQLVYVSTSEIYGGGVDGLCSESTNAVIVPKYSARLEYAAGKLASEIALVNRTRQGLICSIVRPFNVAGPGQLPDGGFVIPRFVMQARGGNPLTVFGEGGAIRAFTHVSDICAGLELIADLGVNGEAYNLGNAANKTTILELAMLVVRLCKSSSRIEFVNPKDLFGPEFEEAKDKYPDAAKAESLGWHPKKSLSDIITDYRDAL